MSNRLELRLLSAGWSATDLRCLQGAKTEEMLELRHALPCNRDITIAIEEYRVEIFGSMIHCGASPQEFLRLLARLNWTHRCIDLVQLKSLQAKGLEFFRLHFAGERVYAWRGVTEEGYVPRLVEVGNSLVIEHVWLGGKLEDYDTTIMLN